jgi:glutamine amidotransferase
MHNGLITDFHAVKRELVLAIDRRSTPFIEGSTDSETFFHLALTMGLQEDPPGAVERAVGSSRTSDALRASSTRSR